MYAQHAELASTAKRKLMPLLRVSPLKETNLVALMDASWMGSMELERQLQLKRKMGNVTGLMDEHYCRRLLISLWIDADRPSANAEPFPVLRNNETHRETTYRETLEEFFKDRRNWSRWNLQMYVTQKLETSSQNSASTQQTKPTEDGIRALAKLQLHTTPKYKVRSIYPRCASCIGCG